MMSFRFTAILAIYLLAVVRFELAPVSDAFAADEVLTVFAAASLKGALDDVSENWQEVGGAPLRISYASTPALARQIEQGAPADIFFSADEDWMDSLERQQLILSKSRLDVLGNKLALIANVDAALSGSFASKIDLAAMLGDGRLAVADTKSVPAGKYATAALRELGLWETVESKLVEAENVRAALQLVALNEAPLGIVYLTDARSEPRVKIVDLLPESSYPPIRYPAAAVATSNKAAAQEFLLFLRSDAAGTIFRSFGFDVLR